MAASPSSERRLIVLGSTGSIGVNTLEVVAHLQHTGAAGQAIRVVGLAAGRSAETLIQQARRFQVPALAVADPDCAAQVRAALPGVTVYAGPQAAEELVDASDATDVSAAVVGSAGLPATLAAVRRGMTIGLANKETLVAAGELVTPLLHRHGARLIPVDSEHSAIFQCLERQRSEVRGQRSEVRGQRSEVRGQKSEGRNRKSEVRSQESEVESAHLTSDSLTSDLFPPASDALTAEVKRIVLTSSGGPFRTTPKALIEQATVEEALNHPTWKMGPKITIDSASMMNKALEVIEAHWLFDLPGEKIGVLVHPQSIIHSFVEFQDHSILAQLGPPDMRTPIQYALTYPRRAPGCSRALDWSQALQLEFIPPDHERFPALRLAYDVIKAGGTAGAIFNAANEAAVAAFLERRIRFGRIVEFVADALAALDTAPVDSVETVLEADRRARAFVNQRIARLPADAPR